MHGSLLTTWEQITPKCLFTKQDIFDTLSTLIFNIETYDITTIRASMGMFLVSKYISENTDIKVLMTGEISDEIFGYKYTDFAPSPCCFPGGS